MTIQVLNLNGDVNKWCSFSLEEIEAASKSLKKGDTLRLNIDSHGGNAEEARKIVEHLTELNKKGISTHGVVKIKANSAAAVIFLACKTKTIYKNATVLFHLALTAAHGNKEQLKEAQTQLTAIDNWQTDLIKANSTMTVEKIKEVLSFGRSLTASELKSFGIVSEVKEEEFTQASKNKTIEALSKLDANLNQQVFVACMNSKSTAFNNPNNIEKFNKDYTYFEELGVNLDTKDYIDNPELTIAKATTQVINQKDEKIKELKKTIEAQNSQLNSVNNISVSSYSCKEDLAQNISKDENDLFLQSFNKEQLLNNS